MIVATLLVIMMTIPGLALFYGGLVRSKNMLSVLMQVFVTFSLIVVLWVRLRLQPRVHRGQRLHRRLRPAVPEGPVRPGRPARSRWRPPSARASYIPEMLFVAFQATFAGHHLLPDRRRLRRAHQVLARCCCSWCCGSPSAMRRSRTWSGSGWARTPTPATDVVDAMNAKAGLIWQMGRARLRRRHRGAHQRRGGRPGRRLHDRQARRLRQRSVHAALADADDGRRLAAVGGLVRLQRRLGARSRQQRRARLHEHASRPPRPRCWPGASARR